MSGGDGDVSVLSNLSLPRYSEASEDIRENRSDRLKTYIVINIINWTPYKEAETEDAEESGKKPINAGRVFPRS